MAKLLAPGVVSTPAAATSSRRLLAFVWLRQTQIAHFPTFIMLAAGVILMLPRMPKFPRI